MRHPRATADSFRREESSGLDLFAQTGFDPRRDVWSCMAGTLPPSNDPTVHVLERTPRGAVWYPE